MPWSGSGVFNRLYSWVSDASAGVKIRADRMDAEFNNYKAGIENCLARDGQNQPSANLNMGGKKITNVGNATAAGDALTYGQLFTGPFYRKNLLRNAAFAVWQPGVSFAVTPAAMRTADCWWALRAGSNFTVSRVTGQRERYGVKLQRTAGDATVGVPYFSQSLETQDVGWIKAQIPQLCLSFWAKAGANFSAAGSTLTVTAFQGTGTDEAITGTYTGLVQLLGYTPALTTTLTRYSATIQPDANCNELAIRFEWLPAGTAGADDSVTIEAVQLEVGAQPTDLDRLKLEDYLQQAQRYFYKTFPLDTAPAQNAGVVGAYSFPQTVGSATPMFMPLPGPTYMRAQSPTVTLYNPSATNAQVRNVTAGSDCSASTPTGGYQKHTVTLTTPAGSAIAQQLSVHYTVADPTF